LLTRRVTNTQLVQGLAASIFRIGNWLIEIVKIGESAAAEKQRRITKARYIARMLKTASADATGR